MFHCTYILCFVYLFILLIDTGQPPLLGCYEYDCWKDGLTGVSLSPCLDASGTYLGVEWLDLGGVAYNGFFPTFQMSLPHVSF